MSVRPIQREGTMYTATVELNGKYFHEAFVTQLSALCTAFIILRWYFFIVVEQNVF